MGSGFAPYEPDQALLLPPSLRDWLPDDHLCYFIADTVDQLDIAPITSAYRRSGSGNVAYHPLLMLKLLIYGYCQGIMSSRKLAKEIDENVAFRILAAGQRPSHRSLSRFRQQHIDAFASIFAQVVQIAGETGIAKMGTLAVDGTKVKANASKHKAMSYERMQAEEERLNTEIAALLKAAEDEDALEDIQFGPDFRGDEVPEELQRREQRLATIRAAKARLEARKREEEADAIARDAEADQIEKETGRKKRGPKRIQPAGTPKPKDQENFTDPDSRIMKASSGGFDQCYNAQAGVDGEQQIIVAAEVTQSAADTNQLLPMVKQASDITGQQPKCVLADAGYRSEQNFEALETDGVEAIVSIGKEGRTHSIGPDKPATKKMQCKLKTKRGRALYATRKHVVEPVFGWIKRGQGFRAFSMRGLRKVSAEWKLVCLAQNLRRMHRMIEWA